MRGTTIGALLALAAVPAGCELAARERARDALALLIENEPLCRTVATAGTREPRGPARRALAAAALAAVREGSGELPRWSSRRRLLDRALGEQERACGGELALPPASLAAVLAARWALAADEIGRRSLAYTTRLDAAVTAALEEAPPERLPDAVTGSPPAPSPDRESGPAPPAPRAVGRGAGPLGSPGIDIRPASGESWDEVRRRRARQRARGLARWVPLYRNELAALERERRALGRALERQPLARLRPLCRRLGEAARGVDLDRLGGSPERRLDALLVAAVAEYARAAGSCGRGRWVASASQLAEADRLRAAAARRVGALVRRRGDPGGGPGGRQRR